MKALFADLSERIRQQRAHDFGIALAEMAAEALRHVDHALARLERGEYGLCVDCNEKISPLRDRAVAASDRIASSDPVTRAVHALGIFAPLLWSALVSCHRTGLERPRWSEALVAYYAVQRSEDSE